ncbi:proteasome endopeptidase complex, archaeal, beta subunit [Candidatus Bathyarchaeota archaeon]|nr:MAG: proteasome endopeptidase complex, archaeal, beta subunit [Candidatus Bathyarchaeota archaeon]
MYREYPVPGATTVGIACKDGVILAAEKRVTYGYLLLSKTGKKIFKLTDRIGAACAGLIGDMQTLVREASAYASIYALERRRPISVGAMAKLIANLLFERRLFPLITQTIIGGVDIEGSHVYVLDPLGSVIPDKYASVGSGAEIATGILEAEYKDDLTIEQGKNLALRSIKAAVARDIQSGDGVDFLIITADGSREESIDFK